MSYAPQPGYPYQQPGYGQYGPPGHGPYGTARPTTAPAYVVAAIFLLCGGFTLLGSIMALGDESDAPDIIASVVGLAFTEDATGNMDFAISMSMSVACTTLTVALAMFARLEFLRWILGFLGGLVTLYYVYAVIYLLSHDGEKVVGVPIAALLVWAAATVLVFLPHTARAMRGYQRKLALGHVQQPY